jgi:hypothetical protein
LEDFSALSTYFFNGSGRTSLAGITGFVGDYDSFQRGF